MTSGKKRAMLPGPGGFLADQTQGPIIAHTISDPGRTRTLITAHVADAIQYRRCDRA